MSLVINSFQQKLPWKLCFEGSVASLLFLAAARAMAVSLVYAK
jgi:hypothetical protein